MTDDIRSDTLKQELELRLKTLEDQSRFTLNVLEMASSLGDFQAQVNKLQDPSEIFLETSKRVGDFVPFEATAYYLVNEDTQDFEPYLCLPDDNQSYLSSEVETLIESGVFPLAVRENRPIIVYSSDMSRRLVLHVLATNARTRGMFIGILDRKEPNLSSLFLSLLSIILKNCANAVESFELYRLYRSSEYATHNLLDTLPLPAFTLSKEGNVLKANQTFLDFFSVQKQSPHFHTLIQAQDVPKLHRYLEMLTPGKTGAPLELAANPDAAGPPRFDLYCLLRGGNNDNPEYLCQVVPSC